MLTLHCSTQGAGDYGLTPSRSALARDWLDVTPQAYIYINESESQAAAATTKMSVSRA